MEGSRQWPPVLPFPVHNLPTFPTDAFPGWLRNFVEAEAIAKQTPADMQALLGLGVVSVAVMGKVTIEVGEGWQEPLNIYGAVIMESGERKSPAVRVAVCPIEDYEAERNRVLQDEIAQAETEREILAGQLQKFRKDAVHTKSETERGACRDKAKRLAEELAAFTVPTPLQLLADDVTPEALPSLLQEQGGRLAIVSSEGGLFDTMAGRYSNNIPNLDAILKAHDGDTIRVNRTGRPPEYIRNPAITLLLTPQPSVIRDLADKPALRGRGFLARFLFSLPQSRVGYRDNRAPATAQAILQDYLKNLKQLLALAPDHADDGNVCPHVLMMSREAQEVFLAYRDTVEAQLRPGETLGEMKDWGNKLPGRVARLSGLLHLAEHTSEERPTEIPISAVTIQRAIQIGDYFIPHAQAVFAEIGMDRAFDDARVILAWIQRKQLRRFTKRDAQQAHRSRFPQAAGVDRPLEILEERGYLRQILPPRNGPGQPQSPVCLINPCLFDTQNTQNSPIVLTATVMQQAKAHQITAGRQRGKEAASVAASLGSPERDYEVTYYGTLAEVCIYDLLEANGLQPEYSLLEKWAVTKPDMNLEGRTYEIKCCPPGKEYVCISVRQHTDEQRRADGYLCAVYEAPDRIRLCVPIPYEAVNGWDYREDGHEPYHSIHRDALAPLVSLEALRAPQTPAPAEDHPSAEGEWEEAAF